MKNFDEALSIIMQRVKGDVDSPESEAARKSLEELGAPFRATILEIQTDERVHNLAHIILDLGEERSMSGCQLLEIAFSHGVAVGLEMNKVDLPDGFAS